MRLLSQKEGDQMNTTGNRIRELRLRNNLTLDDVAKHLGVGRQAIYKYEQGTVTNIPLENLDQEIISYFVFDIIFSMFFLTEKID